MAGYAPDLRLLRREAGQGLRLTRPSLANVTLLGAGGRDGT